MAKPQYTLVDYVRWMGQLTFEEMPFCETDALVLCEVIYFDVFSTEDVQGKTLSELIRRAPVEDSNVVKCLGGGIQRHMDFIRAVENSRRFGMVTLQKYEETLDHIKSIQFAAAVFGYKDNWNFISYRGTDDTIAGWKEDFMIAFTRTPAQEMALDFAEKNIDEHLLNYVGGHSKGGNLAVYAAAMLPKKTQKSVTHIYDLDGPGFCGEVFDKSLLNHISFKTTMIIPKFSVIGKLFELEFPDTKIVTSNETAVMQHELLSWGVTQNGLDTVSENDPHAENINRIIDDWIENISQQDRKIFVNELFDVLASDGAKTMTDIMKKGSDGFEKILFQAVRSSRSTKKAAAALPEQALFGGTFRNLKQTKIWKTFAKYGLAQSIGMAATGVLFIYANENILNVASMIFITTLTLIQIGLTFKRLRESHWKIQSIRERLYLCIILSVLSISLLFKNEAMFIMGSMIFSISAFITAVYSGMKTADKKNPIFRRILSGIETVLCIIYGFSFLFIPQETVFAYSLSIGSLLIIDAAIRLLFAIWEMFNPQKH